MKIGSLFSGYGGLDIAVENHFDAETVWHAEFEEAPSKVLAAHWPGIPNHHDVSVVDWSAVEPVDIITGGYPCQPFSSAGQRKGLEDERHLWPFVAEAVDVLRPEWVVFENVRGHLTLGFDQVLRDLHLLKYDVRWEVIKASDIGAPHRRERIFILGKDKNAPVRSRTDRRGRLHRDSGNRWIFSGSTQDRNDRQRKASVRPDGQDLRGKHHLFEGARIEPSGRLRVEIDWGESSSCHSTSEAIPTSQGGSCGSSAIVSAHAGNCGQATEWATQVDERHEDQSERAETTDTGSEQKGNRSRASGPTERGDATGEVQGGQLVGASGLSIRSGALRGTSPNVWANDRWRDLRIAEPGNRYRVFILATNSRSAGSQREERWSKRRNVRQGFELGSRRNPFTTDADSDGRRRGRPLTHQPRHPSSQNAQRHDASSTRTPQQTNTTTAWGDYQPAIKRWERAMGRPAPKPTQPTRSDGKHQLSPVFVEWMMGLNPGHVTSIDGISRANQLKMLGNGVVPQQALAALQIMTERMRHVEAAHLV